MKYTVTQGFATVTRRFRVGAEIEEADMTGDRIPLRRRIERGEIAAPKTSRKAGKTA